MGNMHALGKINPCFRLESFGIPLAFKRPDMPAPLAAGIALGRGILDNPCLAGFPGSFSYRHG
jgi:hypothetical protein